MPYAVFSEQKERNELFTTHHSLFTFLPFYAKITNMNIIKINDNSNKLFYIGGVVRDELLGRESLDVDITYVGNAES